MAGMNPDGKYKPFADIPLTNREWPSRHITKAPLWCSVDLRDGNQALVNPMGIEQKLEYFDMLVKLGFKQIEVGFPSSNETEFNFIRRLIEENHVPSDVTLQVLCQAREHLVKRTFEALDGLDRAIFHLYSAISPSSRKYVFNKTKEEIIALAADGIKCIKKYMTQYPGIDIMLEYSPEHFSTSEIDFSLEVCEAVKKEWQPSVQNKLILNLPTTVERSLPNQFADQIEYFCRHISDRDKVIISLHNHNDRGECIAQCEMGLLAGAERVEGCLFGNGERTGNLDIITMALNMYTQGVNPELDFSDIDFIADKYVKLTGMEIHPRTPYAGELVYTAFSGSHQDAIRKALIARKSMTEKSLWDVPYLPIDPLDIGRKYEAIIRINSQSGKGGAAYILEEKYNISLPKAMHPLLGAVVKEAADKAQCELSAEDIYTLFENTWLNNSKNLCIADFAQTQIEGKKGSDSENTTLCRAVINWKGQQIAIGDKGNGPLDAFSNALSSTPAPHFSITAFHEHSAGSGNNAFAFAYIQITCEDGKQYWGVGKSTSIGRAGINAVVSALNQID